jgi:aminomethyltransferase
MLKRTPLFSAHQKLGAKLIDFGGWEMPVQYTSITDEHLAARNAAGIFDISHMGEITVSGAGAETFLNSVLTNDIRKLASGEGQYTLMCNERGGVIDDLYAYKLSAGVYFLIINASRIESDVAWLQAQAATFSGELKLTDASHQYAAIAVQGPRVKEFIDDCIPSNSTSCARVGRVIDLKKNQIGGFKFENHSVLVSRTGYTGEDGFEIYIAPSEAARLWNEILAAGAEFGIKPCGLGARNTLRLEAKMALYGHEIHASILPWEADLAWIVKMNKGPFVGRQALEAAHDKGLTRKLVGFEMIGRGIGRDGYEVWIGGTPAGFVTSGGPSPTLCKNIGLCYLSAYEATPGRKIQIVIRGQAVDAVTVETPFYKRSQYVS